MQTELEDFAYAEIIEPADDFVGYGMAFMPLAVAPREAIEVLSDAPVAKRQRTWEVLIEN